MLKRTLILGPCLCLLLTGCNEAELCKNFLDFNGDTTAVRTEFQKNPEQTAWEWFVCLNQDNANKTKREWENFKPTSAVYLSNGAAPASYNTPAEVPAQVITKATALGMDTTQLFHNLDADLQVDGLPLEMGGQDVPSSKTAQLVRYQLLMSAGTFEYIVGKKVYNVNGQEALTADLNFPANAWELKTSWLWIGGNATFRTQLENDGYYIVNSYYKDKTGAYQVGYAALSGMHVTNKLMDDWIWATFENKNNSKYTITNKFPAESMTNQTGPTAAAKAQNAKFQSENPELAAYEMIGVQWSFDRDPKLLANSQMESAFQNRSSCIACHSTAAYSKEQGYYNFAHAEQGGIVYPIDKTPSSAFDNYKKLDFVWSLKRASWER